MLACGGSARSDFHGCPGGSLRHSTTWFAICSPAYPPQRGPMPLTNRAWCVRTTPSTPRGQLSAPGLGISRGPAPEEVEIHVGELDANRRSAPSLHLTGAGAQHRPAPETRSSAVPAPGHRTRSRRASRNRRWHFAEAVRSGGVMLCHDAERNPPRWPRLLPPSRSPITPGLSVTTVPADARSLRSPVHVPPEPLTSATPPRCSCVQPRMVAAISRISSLLQAPILQRAGSGSRFRGNLDSGSDLDARRRSKKWRIAGHSAKRYCHWSGCGLGTLLCTSFSFSSLHTFPVTRANM